MKKSIICAAAAIVALSSCSKTQFVYTNSPEEIGFKAVNGAMTKVVQTTGAFSQDMGVIAYQGGKTDVYFTNADFNNVSTTWECDEEKYWPIDSSLDFFVYSPYQATNVTPDPSAKTLTVVVPNNGTNQWDYLYSNAYITGKDKNSGNIPVDFDHALAYVTVNFSGEDVITLSDAKLNGTYQSGTYTVTYGTPTTVAWSAQGNATDLNLSAGALTADYSTSWMVVPESTGNTITFDYTIAGMTGDAISKEITLSESWKAGTHYTYNVTIGANEIEFEVHSVTGWDEDLDDDPETDDTIDKQIN